MDGHSLLLRARVVVPVTRPPLDDGAVFISGGRIAEVGRWSELVEPCGRGRRVDLGEVILLPGMVNAHCHLDYTGMAAGIPPQKSFSDWIKAILAHKAAWSYTDYAQSWLQGAEMLLQGGVTTVLDIEAVPELLPEAWAATPLRLISALEMTGIRSGKEPEQVLSETLAAVPSLQDDRKQLALSPHSLYATRPALMQLAHRAVTDRGWLLTSHIAESQEEFDMFVLRGGRMHDWLAGQRDLSDCDGASPVACLERLGLLSSRLVAVHVNCLGEGDADRLARHGVSVVHCPRSHEYFHHPPFPLAELSGSRVNVCLGTDSLASVRGTNRDALQLSLFSEMQRMTAAFRDLAPEAIVRMVTVNGARALGRAGDLGEIKPGAWADLIAIPWAGPSEGALEAVVQNEKPAAASFIAGERVL